MSKTNFFNFVTLFAFAMAFSFSTTFASEPVRIIFDTDLGNDVDDPMALAVAHSLQSRGELRILAVTSTKSNKYVAPVVGIINTFYGRPDIPVGITNSGITPEDGRYIKQLVEAKDAAGKPLFPSNITTDTQLPDAVTLIRKTLAAVDNKSVVFVQIGFFTNLARLFETKGDDISPLSGLELFRKKVRYVSLMAGGFGLGHEKSKEYNVVSDLEAAKKVVAACPVEMVFSGFEIGAIVDYTVESINNDYEYVVPHPIKIAYKHYRGLDKRQATFDINAVIYAARPSRGYYSLSEKGTVTITDEGVSTFTPNPDGKHRYQKTNIQQIAATREAIIQLTSQPPAVNADGKAIFFP
ncbi:MAG: nucleoside hydrolase [Planctomycetaceae bacterium]|jgi:inosine-uridine nucleoside N-ribohydrolase|nr:nucleoside hydrolase [Planctomycetaceae bacterium]